MVAADDVPGTRDSFHEPSTAAAKAALLPSPTDVTHLARSLRVQVTGLMAVLILAVSLLLVATGTPAGAAQAQAIEPDPHPTRLTTVVDPRAAGGGWVADPAGHLRPATVNTLNAELSRLRDSTGVEIAVVVLDSLEQLTVADAALTLHRRWGVGQRAHDNGLLLLWSPARREITVSVGYGLEGILPDARAGRLLDEAVIPAFRQDAYDAGILAGVRALAMAASEDPASRTRPGMSEEPDDEGGRDTRSLFIALAAFGVAGASAVIPLSVRAIRRRRPRRCPAGHGVMQRVPDAADEEYLSAGEATEERLRSIDYDVWQCTSCGHHDAVPWKAIFTNYKACGACGRRAAKSQQHVLQAATTSSTGRMRVTTTCAHCGDSSVTTRVIPKVSNGSSGGSSGGSRGGSSFGGGSAGGGGASRRY